jgi:hypothetical protein
MYSYSSEKFLVDENAFREESLIIHFSYSKEKYSKKKVFFQVYEN